MIPAVDDATARASLAELCSARNIELVETETFRFGDYIDSFEAALASL